MVRLKEGVSDELPQPPNVADESNVGAIASAATQPLIAQAEAKHSEIVPNLGQILDQQHGPLPEDPNNWFEKEESLHAFTKYLEAHGIFRDTGQGMLGPQSVFLYNVLERQWKELQEELRKMNGGDEFVIEQILRRIRKEVKNNDSHRNEYRKNILHHEAQISNVRRQMKEEEYMTDPDTPGVFKGGAGRLYKYSMFGKRKTPRFPIRKGGKAVQYPKKQWFDPEVRGKDMPTLEYSEKKTAEDLATNVRAAYVKLQKQEPILGPLDMLNMPALSDDQYFGQMAKKSSKRKGARLLKEVNMLNHHIRHRLNVAESLHGIGNRLHAHGEKRALAMQEWLKGVTTDDSMAIEKAHDTHRQESAFAAEARKKFEKSRDKPDKGKQWYNRASHHAARADAALAKKRQAERKYKKPIEPHVSAAIRLDLKEHMIPAKGTGKAHDDFLVNRIAGSTIPKPATRQDIDKFIETSIKYGKDADSFKAHYKHKILPSDRRHSLFREKHAAITKARATYSGDPKKFDPAAKAEAESTVKALKERGDLGKWRLLRDYLQMYDRVTQPGTGAHMYINPTMPWMPGPHGSKPVMGQPEMAEELKDWGSRGKVSGTPNRFMVYPRWSASQKRYVIAPSRIPYGTSAYPRMQKGEGGIFSDFMTRSDLERVVKDLEIKVPDPPFDKKYDDMLLGDERNKVYKPFLAALRAKKEGAGDEARFGKPSAVSNFYTDMRTKDVRMYEAVLKKLQAYREIGINHEVLNEVADFYDTRGLSFTNKLAKHKQAAREQRQRLRSAPETDKSVQASKLEKQRRLRESYSAHFKRVQKSRGTTALYSGPRTKKTPGSLRTEIKRMQSDAGTGHEDWRGLLRLNHERYAMDGTQHKHLERERQNILHSIKSLKFGWNKLNEHGNPHSSVLNKIGHVENMMVHMGGRDQMNSREKNFYDHLIRSFKRSDQLEVPRENRSSLDLRKLAGEYVSVHQGLINHMKGPTEDFNRGWNEDIALDEGGQFFARKVGLSRKDQELKRAGFSLKSSLTPAHQFKLAKQRGLGVAATMERYLKRQEVIRSPHGKPRRMKLHTAGLRKRSKLKPKPPLQEISEEPRKAPTVSPEGFPGLDIYDKDQMLAKIKQPYNLVEKLKGTFADAARKLMKNLNNVWVDPALKRYRTWTSSDNSRMIKLIDQTRGQNDKWRRSMKRVLKDAPEGPPVWHMWRLALKARKGDPHVAKKPPKVIAKRDPDYKPTSPPSEAEDTSVRRSSRQRKTNMSRSMLTRLYSEVNLLRERLTNEENALPGGGELPVRRIRNRWNTMIARMQEYADDLEDTSVKWNLHTFPLPDVFKVGSDNWAGRKHIDLFGIRPNLGRFSFTPGVPLKAVKYEVPRVKQEPSPSPERPPAAGEKRPAIEVSDDLENIAGSAVLSAPAAKKAAPAEPRTKKRVPPPKKKKRVPPPIPPEERAPPPKKPARPPVQPAYLDPSKVHVDAHRMEAETAALRAMNDEIRQVLLAKNISNKAEQREVIKAYHLKFGNPNPNDPMVISRYREAVDDYLAAKKAPLMIEAPPHKPIEIIDISQDPYDFGQDMLDDSFAEVKAHEHAEAQKRLKIAHEQAEAQKRLKIEVPPELPPITRPPTTPAAEPAFSFIDVGRTALDLPGGYTPKVGWTPFREWLRDTLTLEHEGNPIYANERELLEAYLNDKSLGPRSEDGTPIKISQGILQWEKEHGPLEEDVKPEPKPEPEERPLPPALQYRDTAHPIQTPAPTRPSSPEPEEMKSPDPRYDPDELPEFYPEVVEMPDLEEAELMRHFIKLEGAIESNYLNPINLTGIPFGMHSHHKTAVVARNVPRARRPLFQADDVNITDLVHRFQHLEMPSRVHMVQAASHIQGHIMHDMWEDVNMGQRRVREKHGRTGPFGKRRGRSRVMSKSANVQGRSRGKLYEVTIHRKVTQYELNMVMKKLRVHMRSAVGTLLFLHFGKSKKLLGDLISIDLDELKKTIRRKLERHVKVGLEVTDAQMGGALHNPVTHTPQFTRSLL